MTHAEAVVQCARCGGGPLQLGHDDPVIVGSDILCQYCANKGARRCGVLGKRNGHPCMRWAIGSGVCATHDEELQKERKEHRKYAADLSKSESHLLSSQLCSAFGITVQHLHRWTNVGIINPSMSQKHGFPQRVYSVMDALTVAVALQLRHRNIGTSDVRKICNWLNKNPLKHLQSEITDGRTCLFFVGDLPLIKFVAPDAQQVHTDLIRCLLSGSPVAVVDIAGPLAKITDQAMPPKG